MREPYECEPVEEMPICPMCGEECNEFYVYGREIVGCERCIDTESAWERREEDRENALIDMGMYQE